MPTPRCNDATAATALASATPAAANILQITPMIPPGVHANVSADRPLQRIATPADASFVCDLQKRFSNELGFLPRQAIDWYLDNGRILLQLENGQAAGYLLGRRALRCQPWTAPLTQTAIRYDAQHRDNGRILVEHAAARAAADGRSIIQAWCRIDIEATAFWRALGFSAVAIRRPPTTRQQPLILWRRPLNDLGRSRLLILPTAAGYQATADPTIRHLTPGDRLMLPSTFAAVA